MNIPGYEYLPHPADVRFKAYGTTLEEVFEQAAHAMFHVIIDTAALNPEHSVDIKLESQGLDNLLYDYLSELLYLFEVEEIVFGQFRVDSIEKTDGSYILHGQASGENIDLERHSFETEVKAITYHQLEITKEKDGYSAHVIVDT
ncbi:MAG: SHS2 domain-containing protein [Candidatus Methanocomedens sp.]|nr:MAG: SHS2 domain-containing protein [ANME-2 cluster archaeon]